MKTKMKVKTTMLKAKPLPKLDDLADHAVEIVEMFYRFSNDYCDGDRGFYEFLEPGKTKLKGRLSEIVIVNLCDEAEKLRLLAVVATAGTCDMFPKAAKLAFTAAEIEKTLAVVDGWYVTTMIGGSDPRLCFSIVRKKTWIEAGRPMVLDVAFDPKRGGRV